jgi:hypothetical protein
MKNHQRNDSAAPQILVIGASSDSGIPDRRGPPVLQLDTPSNLIDVLLTVVWGNQRQSFNTRIDPSCPSNAIFHELTREIKELRTKLQISENSDSKCVYTLSGGGKPIKGSFSCLKHLEKALAEFRANGSAAFEIEDTISSALDDSPTTCRDGIRGRLVSSRTQGAYNGSFTATEAVRTVLLRREIEKVFGEDHRLRQLPLSKTTELIKKIYEEGLRLLATIILAGVEPFGELIQAFTDNEMLDSDMPFGPEECPPFLRSKRVAYESICRYQWEFFPLDLRSCINAGEPSVFPKEMVIPVEEKTLVSKGGFGDVYAVKLRDFPRSVSVLHPIQGVVY